MIRTSVLDLCPITEGSTPAQALRNSLDLAQQVERFGYHRYWVAEHHNSRGIASAATSVVIGYLAAGTRTMTIGSGGIMLPNHSPLVIAEQFGTLASIYPGRIELGLGRAPGTDPQTAYALRRNLSGDVDNFPRDVIELQQYLGDPLENQRIFAVPGMGTHVPLWILGSSLYGAQLAAMLGLPYAFASHFAPEQMMNAIRVYREKFEPSESLKEPYVMLGYNICAADSDEEAEFLRSSAKMSFINRRKGQRTLLPPPVENLEDQLEPLDQAILKEMKAVAAVGSKATVTNQIREFLAETGADELILACSMFEHDKRVRSYEIAAGAIRELQDTTAIEAG